ncbi:hypothetical protein E0H70_18870 [Rhizobium leguminosarum bv. viciae]|nr:hypothetical protein E0H70_18870 [Rhizobium leguminosarum bv. viciae]
MRWATTAAAVELAATGLIVLVSPVLFGRLVLEGELSEPGQALGRLRVNSMQLSMWATFADHARMHRGPCPRRLFTLRPPRA